MIQSAIWLHKTHIKWNCCWGQQNYTRPIYTLEEPDKAGGDPVYHMPVKCRLLREPVDTHICRYVLPSCGCRDVHVVDHGPPISVM